MVHWLRSQGRGMIIGIVFQTPSERGNGSLFSLANEKEQAPLCFKPLQSGAMVHWASHHG